MTRLRHGTTLACALGAAAALAFAQAAPPAPKTAKPRAPAAPQAAAALRLVPRARQLSTYLLQGRLDLATRDVTYEVPPAYRDKFNFWTGRMRGQKRSELYEFRTSTQERAEDGTVPFKRILARFQLEMEKEGKPLAPYGSLPKDMTTFAWEGTFDPLGNVKEIEKVQGVENPDMAELWMPMIEKLFPPLPAVREIAVGTGFTDVDSLPPPSRLHIRGLDDIRVRVTREYVLKEGRAQTALFEVRTTYALDPGTAPADPGTTCVISGGGSGEATFDVRRGVYLATTLPTTMTIDVEAPLQPIEGQTQAGDPGRGKTRIELDIRLSGWQTVQRYWGEEED